MDRDLDNGKESVIDTEGRGGALVWHFGVAVYGTYWHCGAWFCAEGAAWVGALGGARAFRADLGATGDGQTNQNKSIKLTKPHQSHGSPVSPTSVKDDFHAEHQRIDRLSVNFIISFWRSSEKQIKCLVFLYLINLEIIANAKFSNSRIQIDCPSPLEIDLEQ